MAYAHISLEEFWGDVDHMLVEDFDEQLDSLQLIDDEDDFDLTEIGFSPSLIRGTPGIDDEIPF